MQLTHFGHACVLVSDGTTRVLFDPGTFSDGWADLTDLDAVVVTHSHPDHLDTDRLPGLLAANRGARLVTDVASAQDLGEHDPRAVQAGEQVALGGLSARVVGGSHAIIHPDIPTIPNVGFVVEDGAFYHPGDSYAEPGHPVDVLGLPTGAPWLKVSEAVEFFRRVSPRVAVPIHEAVLADPSMHVAMFDSLKPAGSSVRRLDRGVATQV